MAGEGRSAPSVRGRPPVHVVANVFELDWTDRHDPGLAGKTTRLGAPAGAERLGATVYEIAPGAAGSPLHAHHANEELIIVLAGSPTLRTADSH